MICVCLNFYTHDMFHPTSFSAWNSGAVTAETASQWITEQMNKPMTSHREWFRLRANPRNTHSQNVGRSHHPCDGLSRWRRFAFSRKDGDNWWFKNTFEASFREGDSYITLKLNGHTRTVVNAIAFDNTDYTLEYNMEYLLCGHPDERVGGRFRLRIPEDNSCQYISPNPLVQFYGE
jgi:hypothetical protein